MHILHLSSAISWRGGEQQVAYLLEGLVSCGHQVTVFCPKRSSLAEFCRRGSIPLHTYTKRMSIDPFVIGSLVRLFRQKKFDIAHTHDAQSHSQAVLAHRLSGSHLPLVVSRRVAFPIKKKGFSNYKYNYAGVQRILCVSEAIKKKLQGAIQHSERLTTVYSGIDENKFKKNKSGKLCQELNIDPATFLIGNTSALSYHKDYQTFINTAVRLREAGIMAKFLLIGRDDGMEDTLRNYIQQQKFSEDFYFLGFRKDVPEILPDLDVFLFTPMVEGLGTSVLDAFACGVPVVATNTGGIPEMVHHEQTGLLADTGDDQALAQHVQWILENPQESKELTENAYQLLHQKFTRQSTLEATLRVYEVEKRSATTRSTPVVRSGA
ncbi:MAG: glycosyltransferase family 4 protein [Bernardetiaceae bacterium]